MPCDSNTDCSRDAQSPTTSPLKSLADSLFAIPRSIFEQGQQRGEQWRWKHSEGHDSRWRRSCPRWNTSDNQSPDSPREGFSSATRSSLASGDDGEDGDDWLSWIKQEMKKREQQANEFYKSWDHAHETEANSSAVQADTRKITDHLRDLDGYMKEVESSMEKAWSDFFHTPQDIARKPLGHLLNQFEPESDFYYDAFVSLVEGHTILPYLATSVYSPLYLEEQLDSDGGMWRAKFEDLMRVSHGQEMLSRREVDEISQLHPWDWMNRFAHPNQKQRIDRRIDIPTTAHVTIPSELDAYEQAKKLEKHVAEPVKGETERSSDGSYLKQQISEQRRINKQWDYRFDSSGDEAGVKSIYRTVNEEMQENGSVTTKTVVRKQFTDGREETTEIYDTRPAQQRAAVEPPNQENATSEHKQPFPAVQESSSPLKSGWFWSR